MPIEILLWLAVGGLFYTFLGYPLLISAWSRLRPYPAFQLTASPLPRVCVIVVAFNEQDRIVARIENLLASNYPAESLRVLVVSDGSTDGTADVVNAIQNPRLGMLNREVRCGKAACLNAAIPLADAEVIVLTDSRQTFEQNTIQQLVGHFANPKAGAVSGALEIQPSNTNVGGGVDSYWRLEKYIRARESYIDSTIGCTGSVYAIRRDLYAPIPSDTILDDVLIPMQIALKGYRVLFEAEAVAYDPQPLEPELEKRRKVRTLGGNFQIFFRYPGWLLPWRNRLVFQLVSHKYCRLFAPVLLFVAFLSNLMLSRLSPGYSILFYAQCCFYLCGALGFSLRETRSSFLRLPSGFLFLNMMTVRGLWYFLTATGRHGWEGVRK